MHFNESTRSPGGARVPSNARSAALSHFSPKSTPSVRVGPGQNTTWAGFIWLVPNLTEFPLDFLGVYRVVQAHLDVHQIFMCFTIFVEFYAIFIVFYWILSSLPHLSQAHYCLRLNYQLIITILAAGPADSEFHSKFRRILLNDLFSYIILRNFILLSLFVFSFVDF